MCRPLLHTVWKCVDIMYKYTPILVQINKGQHWIKILYTTYEAITVDSYRLHETPHIEAL